MANVASGQGGGIYTGPNTTTMVTSSTVTNNSAAVGGGIAALGRIQSGNNTITRNLANQTASSIYSSVDYSFTVINTIIGPDVGQSVDSVSGTFASLGKNIVTNTTGSSGWQFSDLTNDNIDPMLGPLANNGGQTDSFALLQGSPAIESGDICVTGFGFGCGPLGIYFDILYDQRKYSRWAASSVDIGSFESGSAPNQTIQNTRLFAGYPTLAHSRVIVTETETMQRQSTFVISGIGTAPVTLNWNGVYVIEIYSKRRGVHAPLLYSFGSLEFY
ncbi:MAG: choice-of-anchor Q domain-containing protein [Pyrinomonadaceae bacterium]